jgi:hypothetical protein
VIEPVIDPLNPPNPIAASRAISTGFTGLSGLTGLTGFGPDAGGFIEVRDAGQVQGGGRMSRRAINFVVIYIACVIGLMMFQPGSSRRAFAQTDGTLVATSDLIGALGAQATANAQATRAAYQSQQSAGQAAQNAAALQAQAANMQAQAAAAQAQALAQAQQATAAAEQQRTQLAALQATADAAALQATAIVQQTRTALEVKATQTAIAIESDKQRAVVAATRAAVEAQDRDNRAVATSVAVSMHATKQAIDVKARLEAAQAESDRQARETGNRVLIALMIAAGVMGMILLFKGFRRASSKLDQPAPATPLTPSPSSSAALMVIDASTGDIAPRVGEIEVGENSPEAKLIRRMFAYGEHA